VKFLIDECLSPELTAIAWNQGFHSMHVTRVGLRSKSDSAIVQHAIEDDWVLVTNNVTDFKRLVGTQEVHPGLICINVAPGLMKLEVQKSLFRHALKQVAGDDPINTVVEITLLSDSTVRTSRYTWPR